LVAATTDRILREAEYRAAQQGDPELVIASDPHLQADNGNFATALLQQIHARQSDLEQEQAQLNIEHGPNFPRVVEDSPPVAGSGPAETGRGRQAWWSASAAQLADRPGSRATGAQKS
jgi:uncharacterized protein involved in exopolysaccharide biosynthesis